jgi:hypothetical protein
MCRKLPFVLLIQRMQRMFPKEYSFIPPSFVLPAQETEFDAARKSWRRSIIKPDTGSVGFHIVVLKPDVALPDRVANGYVGQEYLESMPLTIGGQQRKFDFRVYVVVTKLDPLTIHMSTEGLTRVCAAEYGIDCPTAQLTNTAINKGVNGVQYTDITYPFLSVLQRFERLLEREKRVNTKVREEFGNQTMLDKIKDLIARTVIAARPEMLRGCDELLPKSGDLMCFQIFGFDILIGENFKPYVLEVNYRPSLKWGMPEEEAIKKKLLIGATHIAVCQKKKPEEAPEVASFLQICPNRKYSKEIESCDRDAQFDPMLSNLVKGTLEKVVP